MQVTVFGASGKVGRRVVTELIRRGHTVVAFVHHSSLPPADNLRVVHGDIYDQASVAAALEGSQAVVSALGSWGTAQKNVVSTATETIIPAMQAASARRIVTVTGSASQVPGEKLSMSLSVTRVLFKLLQPKILRDGENHIAMLADSDLDWTVVRSPIMTGSSSRSYRLRAHTGSLTVSRTAVAQAMVDLVEPGDWLRQAPIISHG